MQANPRMKRAAIYLRVRTDDQSLENQRGDVERVAKARGFKVVARYEEHVSAAKDRPEFKRMLEDAHRGKFSVLVVWAIDRFGRSMAGNVRDLKALDAKGVEVVSVKESWLDMGGPTRDLLLSIFSWIAEQERVRIGERTRAGLKRAKRDGKRLGRPERHVNVEKALRLRDTGYSVRQIAKALGVSKSVVAARLSGKG
jgi:DNA invertase Pin-like site-specific DNA recombinase